MVRRRQRQEAEAKELSLRPRPPPPVDMRGWSPADGEAKPLIDEFLRYAPSSGRSALGDMKALERREAELRAQTKEKLEDLRECISTIVQNWDEALAVRIHAPRQSKAPRPNTPILHAVLSACPILGVAQVGPSLQVAPHATVSVSQSPWLSSERSASGQAGRDERRAQVRGPARGEQELSLIHI